MASATAQTAFLPGQVRPHIPEGRSQAHPGVHPLLPLLATQSFEPLPTPLGVAPYHYDLESVIPGITALAAKNGKLTFHCVGDTGGIKNPNFQNSVADAMKADLQLPATQAPSFFYHLGDVVYFNGQITDYYSQFYDPYNHYTAPILSIPGNHDGDPINSTQVSLDGWVRYFMQATAHVNPESQDAPRATLSEPNVYFTLNCPFATIVGMYTNVPEGGSIDSVQQQWLTNEFATASADKALIVALHHPVYSFDAVHSGSARMADVIQGAINDTLRVPNLVLMAHVHNYQRIERSLVKGAATPFLVAGNGGYYNLHKLSATPGAVDPSTQAKLVAGYDQSHGYMILSVDAKNIMGTAYIAGQASAPHLIESHRKKKKHPPKGGTGAGAANVVDTFTYPASSQFLPKGTTISL